VILTTTETVCGKRVTKTLGLVRGNSVRARNIGRDLMALMRNVVGGEVPEYTKLIAEAREQAIDRMVEQAVELGADAVLCVRFQTTEMMETAAELMAYGTAVLLTDE
jgi:uncharacterized protein YbjQ (UPF0145 family)